MKKIIIATIVLATIFTSCSKNTEALNNSTSKVLIRVTEQDSNATQVSTTNSVAAVVNN